MKRTLIITAALFALAAPAGAFAAHGPQALPEAACNDGAANARDHANASGRDRIPHDHGFGCVHFNPNAPH